MPATKVKETISVDRGKIAAPASREDPLLQTREQLNFLKSLTSDETLSRGEKEFLAKAIRGAEAAQTELLKRKALADWDLAAKSFIRRSANRSPEEVVQAAFEKLQTLQKLLLSEPNLNNDATKVKLYLDTRSIQLLTQVARVVSKKITDEKSWNANDRLSSAIFEKISNALSSPVIPNELGQNLKLLRAELRVIAAEGVLAKAAQLNSKDSLEKLQEQVCINLGYARQFQREFYNEKRSASGDEQKFLSRDLVSREYELNISLARLKSNPNEVEHQSAMLAAHKLDRSGKIINGSDLTHIQKGAVRDFIERDTLGHEYGLLDTPQQVYGLSKEQIIAADNTIPKLSGRNSSEARMALTGVINASLAVGNISAAYRGYQYFDKAVATSKEGTPEHRLADAHKHLVRAQLIDGIGGSSDAVIRELSCSITEFEAQKRDDLLKQAVFLKVKHLLAVIQEQPARRIELGELRDKYGFREDLLGKQLTSSLKRNYAESCGLAGKYKEMESQLELILCDPTVDSETIKWAQSIVVKKQKPTSEKVRKRLKESLRGETQDPNSDEGMWVAMKQVTAELQRAPMSQVKRWAAGGAIVGCVGGALIGGIPGCAVGGIVGLGGGPTALGVLTAVSEEGRQSILEAYQTKLSSITTTEAALNLVGSALDLADGVGVGVALKAGLTILIKNGAIKALVRGLREDLRNPLRLVLREQLLQAGITSIPLNSQLDDMLQIATKELSGRIRDVGGVAVDLAGTGNLLYALGQFANGFVQLESSQMADGDKRRARDNLNSQVSDLALFLFVSHRANKGFTGAIDTNVSQFSVQGVKDAIKEFREEPSLSLLNLQKSVETRQPIDIEVPVEIGVERSMFVQDTDIRHAGSDANPRSQSNLPEGELRASTVHRTESRNLDPSDPRSLASLEDTYTKLHKGLKESAQILAPEVSLNAIEYAHAIIDRLQIIPEIRELSSLKFRVLISDEAQPNAFVTFGSKTGTYASTNQPLIVLTKGLLNSVENEDQLAFIIYHEVAHGISKNKLDFKLSRIVDEISADALSAEWMDKVGYDWRQSRPILERICGKKEDSKEDYYLRKLEAVWDEHPDLKQRLRNTNTHMGQLLATNRVDASERTPTSLIVDLQRSFPKYERELVTEAKRRGLETADNLRKIEIIKEIANEEFTIKFPEAASRWRGILQLLSELPILDGDKTYELELHQLGSAFFSQLVNVNRSDQYENINLSTDASDLAKAIFTNYQLALITKFTGQELKGAVDEQNKIPVGVFETLQSKAIELLQSTDENHQFKLSSELYKLLLVMPTGLLQFKKLLTNLRFPKLEDAIQLSSDNGQRTALVDLATRTKNPHLALVLIIIGYQDEPSLNRIVADYFETPDVFALSITNKSRVPIDVKSGRAEFEKGFNNAKVERQIKANRIPPSQYTFNNVAEILATELSKFEARLKECDSASDPVAAKSKVDKERYDFLTEFANGFLTLRENTSVEKTPTQNNLPSKFAFVVTDDYKSKIKDEPGPHLKEADLDHPFLLFLRRHSDRTDIQSFQIDFAQYISIPFNAAGRKITIEANRLHSVLGIQSPKNLEESIDAINRLSKVSSIFTDSFGMSPLIKVIASDIERVLITLTANQNLIPTSSLLPFLVQLNSFDQRLMEMGSNSFLTSKSAKILSEQVCPTDSKLKAQREADYRKEPVEILLRCLFDLGINKRADEIGFILSIFDSQLSSASQPHRLDHLKELLSISNFLTSDPKIVKKYQTQYVDIVADFIGKEPVISDPNYLSRAEELVRNCFLIPLSKSFAADCIDQLLIKITAQTPTARRLDQIAKEARFGESDKTHFGLKGLEILLDKSAEDRDARLRVIDFLTTELTDESRDAFVSDLMVSGVSGPFRNLFLPTITNRQRPGQKWINQSGEKDQEFTNSRVESIHNFFWSASFETRAAILGQMIVDKDEGQRNQVIYDVLSRICRVDLDERRHQTEEDPRFRKLRYYSEKVLEYAVQKPIEAIWGTDGKNIPPIVIKAVVPPIDFFRYKILPGTIELVRRFEDHPVRSQEDRWTEAFLTTYLKGCEPEEQMVILGAFLAGVRRGKTESGMNYGEVLAEVLESLGPAYVKLGQAISSSSSVPESIRQSLMRLKSRAAAPGRLDLLNRIDRVVPPELKERIVHTGDVLGSASFFMSVDVMYRDDNGDIRPMVLSILREDSKDRAKRGFNKLLATAKQLAEEDGPFKESGNLIISLVEQASGLTDIETDLNTGALQRKRAKELYGSTTVSVDGEPLQFNVMRWYAHGSEFRLAEKAEGVSFAKIVKEGLLPMERIKKLAKGHLAMELRNILRGGIFDEDRHSEQNSVNKSQFNLFDHGAMSLRNPSDAELREAGSLFAALLSSSDWEKDIPAIVSQQIKDHPEAKDYILHIQRGLLALNDFRRVLDRAELFDVFRGVVGSGEIHPIFLNAIEERLRWNPILSMFLNIHGKSSIEFGRRAASQETVVH